MSASEVYYVFSKAGDAARFCAVRQDQPIPRFLDGIGWRFVRTLDLLIDGADGFDTETAEEATRRTGVYFYERAPALAEAWRELRAA